MRALRLLASLRRLAALAGVCGLVAAGTATPASATLLAPQRIDVNTGKDAIEVGEAMGRGRAWAAFIQQTGGKDRVYVASARNGTFKRASLADRANAVSGAELAGNEAGDAVLVFTEKVNGKGVLFARRLRAGATGPVVQVSADGEDVKFGGGMFPLDRGWGLAMNDRGAAAACYVDNTDPNNPKNVAATLSPGSAQWGRHPLQTSCTDPGIDSRGNVAVIGSGANGLSASRIVGGQVKTDPIDANSMDQFNLAVGPGGTALALERDKDFHVVAWRKRDIGQDSAWEKVSGQVEANLIQANASPEDPFAALDGSGKGILTFRDNSMNNPQAYYRLVSGGQPGTGGVLYKSAARGRIAVDARGNAVEAYSTGNNQTFGAQVRIFSAGVPGRETGLAPALTQTSPLATTGTQRNDAGDFLVLLRAGSAPSSLDAVFDDFAPPSLRPIASPKRPRAGKSVTLRSRASDSFGTPTVTWTLPSKVKPARTRRGTSIKVKFKKSGTYRIKVTAVDRGRHRVTKTLKVRVRGNK